jgi:ATP-dependent DNA helicase RecG
MRFAEGLRVRCFGEVRLRAHQYEMVHPETEILCGEGESLQTTLTPVYPVTEGVSQSTLRRLVQQALSQLNQVSEWLPAEILEDTEMPTLVEAIDYLHNPPVDCSLNLVSEKRHPAQLRLVYEELLAHHLSLRKLRQRRTDQMFAPKLNNDSGLVERLLDHLLFAMTSAQQRAVNEIFADLALDIPMQRLLQGDVGSGKTLVATVAMLRAIGSGYQAALMAPTELLAEQHAVNLKRWLAPLGLEVAMLNGSLKKSERDHVLAGIANGEIHAIVGTHALFQADVNYAHLGLVVIDEQHRFGVHQRQALREKGRAGDVLAHQLIMSATPIPRTLAMTAYADLDLSVIDELPPGRQAIETVVISDARREDVVVRIRHACEGGRQAYWVCTLIEESDVLQCQAAVDAAAQLVNELPTLRVGLVHGRLKQEEKGIVMSSFRAGELDVLVATTVIEVGVDVPRASLMVIENAERLGLSQLHQLRGRVGRGAEKSACVLMYHGPLSQHARTRLSAMRETNDGFEIARRDLELRGPGEVLGAKQSGAIRFRIADIVRDQDLIPKVEQGAKCLLERYPDHVQPLIDRWLGDAERYGSV